MSGRQFALMFYKGQVIGSIFGDTQTGEQPDHLGQRLPRTGRGVGEGGPAARHPEQRHHRRGGQRRDRRDVLRPVLGRERHQRQPERQCPGPGPEGAEQPRLGHGARKTGGTLFEAESGTLSAGGTFDSNHTGFTGTGFANPANAAGAYVDIPVTVSAAGTKTLSVRYSDGTSAARPAAISVNGASQGTLNFPVTADWDTWATASISVPLKAGANTIRIAGDDFGGPGQHRLGDDLLGDPGCRSAVLGGPAFTARLGAGRRVISRRPAPVPCWRITEPYVPVPAHAMPCRSRSGRLRRAP